MQSELQSSDGRGVMKPAPNTVGDAKANILPVFPDACIACGASGSFGGVACRECGGTGRISERSALG
jgi:DnaJ-class molecular chaperone